MKKNDLFDFNVLNCESILKLNNTLINEFQSATGKFQEFFCQSQTSIKEMKKEFEKSIKEYQTQLENQIENNKKLRKQNKIFLSDISKVKVIENLQSRVNNQKLQLNNKEIEVKKLEKDSQKLKE